jgi:hypothetical protein
MLEGSYVPYSPATCGGSHSNEWKTQVGGIVAPFTEISSEASGQLATINGFPASTKQNIEPMTSSIGSPIRLQLNVNPDVVIPLTTKIGASNNGGSTPGIWSAGGTGCYFGEYDGDGYYNGNPTGCYDTNAIFGVVYYVISQNTM